MNRPAQRTATYDDVLTAPEHVVAEILRGVLHTQPRPGPRHARAASLLGGTLTDPFDRGRGGPGGWIILDEPEVHLGTHVIVPDLAGWKRTRMPSLPDMAWFELAPDWVCEVLSASTASKDRAIKLPLYAEYHVPHAWLIDPIAGTLETLELKDGRWTILAVYGGQDVAAIAPFDTIEIAVADFLGAD